MTPLSVLKLRIETVVVAFVGLCLLSSGCSNRPESYVSVTGAFRFVDGTPLTGVRGLVRFSSVERASRDPSYADITPEGRFQIWSYVEDGSSMAEGIPVGEYNVVLLVQEPDPQNPVVKEKYKHFEETPWRAIVTKDDRHFVFKLEKN